MTPLDHILDLLSRYKYFAMFGVLVACGMGLPLPEEVTLLASGLAIGWGDANFWMSAAVCLAGILVGDSIVFCLGRYWGRQFLASRPMRLILSRRRQVKVQRLFTKHGNKAVFFARFVAGVRVGVYAYAGQHGMPWFRFFLLDLLGALISAPTSIWIGKFAAEKIADAEDAKVFADGVLRKGEHWLWVGLALLLVTWIAYHLWRRRRDRRTLGPAARPDAAPPASSPGCASGSGGDSPDSP